jgi:predicted AlkP superfamily pyrophosphatase or phosphodiesterase
MAHPTAVIDVVGLSGSLIGDATPCIGSLARRCRMRRLRPVLPAVTCSVQASMVTGESPRRHGVVGNGWYDRDLAEVLFWKQSNRLVGGEKVWETARKRDPSVTCAVLFWWFNMYSSADWSVTPRPIYRADGRKIPDCYSRPPELRGLLQQRLGKFPLFSFWGPGSSIESSRWIAEATKSVVDRHGPTLTLVYLPHLDYGLQKLGPEDPRIDAALREIDAVVGDLAAFFEDRGYALIVLSEYGIEPVDDAVHVNRVLRAARALAVRDEEGTDLLDPGASLAFAVADHQVAHVYVKEPSRVPDVAELLRSTPGVAEVLDRKGQAAAGLDHPRSGELVAVAEQRRWFSYQWWDDGRRAPDFARTVDIHRKPGYDPLELFIDPALRLPKAHIAWTLLKRRLGFRSLLRVVPLDASLVRGSHGRVDVPPQRRPVLLASRDNDRGSDELPCTAVRDVILDHLFRP